MGKPAPRQQNDAEAGRLDAIIVFLAALVRGMVTNRPQVKTAEEKAVLALGQTGMPQSQIAKLLSMDIKRVNALLKSREGKRPKNTLSESEPKPSEVS